MLGRTPLRGSFYHQVIKMGEEGDYPTKAWATLKKNLSETSFIV